MFPEIDLNNLAELSDADLGQLLDECRAAFDEAAAAAVTAEDVARLNEGADTIDAIEAHRTERETAASEVADQVAALRARVNGEAAGGEGDDSESEETEGDDAEGASEDQRESVTAGTRPAAARTPAVRVPATPRRRDLRAMNAARPAARAPRPAPIVNPVQILAAPDLPTHSTGALMERRDLVEAFMARNERIGRSRAVDGEVVPVATMRAAIPESRFFRQMGDAGHHARMLAEMIDALRSGEAVEELTAAGGICAPVTPFYDMMVMAQAGRPVRDFLPSYGADRGGITLIPPPNLADVTGGVSVVTAAQDLAGGVGSEKTCLHVTCGAARTYQIQAISRCLEFGNFGARAFPEQVEAWLDNILAFHARRAETALLDGIAANCIAVTAPGGVGAASELVARAEQAAAGYRSRHRMDPNTTLDALYPSWAINAIRADFARRTNGLENLPTRATIEGWFRDIGIRVGWYLDSKTGGGQVFGAQGVGVLLTFPNVVWYLFAPGTFLFLDGGTLDFGLVRDSVLNARNDYRLHVETFEQVAFLGLQALEVTQTICVDGSAGANRTLTCPV